ncbi:MAG: dephospho-CoA kinase [Candidatus Omnitrophota bacterium]
MQESGAKEKKIILGLTGSFGSGKTTVAAILRSLGAEIIDADSIAHGCYRPGAGAYKKIIELFGRDILDRNEKIDRRKLGLKVFNDKGLLKKLNHIVHPQVKDIIKARLKRARKKVVVIDAPLLIEGGLHRLVHKLIVVKAGLPQQLERISKRGILSRAQILKRIKAQLPLQYKVRLADFIIDNNGTKREAGKQAEKIWKKII